MRTTLRPVITVLGTVALLIVSQSGCSTEKTTTTLPNDTSANWSQITDTSTEPSGGEIAGQGNSVAITARESALPAGYEFEPPVRLRNSDGFVSVESPGYACPTVADVDGDGMDDLVVGQFRNGHLQFYKNVSADNDQPPSLAAAEWIRTGDAKAVVPGVW